MMKQIALLKQKSRLAAYFPSPIIADTRLTGRNIGASIAMMPALAMVAALMLAQFLVQPVAAQEITANATITSNYIWRGVTQTNDNPALQVGADIDIGKGFYAGTWLSNVDFGDDTTYELDLYGGYGGEVGTVSYDIGYIKYVYDDEGGADFDEVYASLGMGGASVAIAWQTGSDGSEDPDNFYLSVGYEMAVMSDYTLAFTLGSYDLDGGTDYKHYGIALSKDAFTLSLSDTDLDDSDPEITLSYGIEF